MLHILCVDILVKIVYTKGVARCYIHTLNRPLVVSAPLIWGKLNPWALFLFLKGAKPFDQNRHSS